MTRLVPAATRADVDLVNVIEPPSRGCHAGDGLHVVIPTDWQARIAAGEDVPGCTCAELDHDGALTVSDRVIAQLALPAVVNALPAQQKAEAALLNAKLLAAVASLGAQKETVMP